MPDAPLSTTPAQPLLRQTPQPLAAAAQVADGAAAARIFDLHRERLSEETCRRHRADLALFATFLETSGAVPPSAELGGRLLADPAAWTSVSWGLVQTFLEWQLQTGYAIGSINVRLSTVKAYAALATRAGALDPNAYALIKLVPGLRHAQGRRIDRQRETTRVGAKKATPTSVSTDQADELKDQEDLLIRFLMCLLVDHGLRVGEVAALTPACVDLDAAQLRFYRSKVDKTQVHDLSDDALAAAEALLSPPERPGEPPPPKRPDDQPLFPSDREIRRIVAAAGEAIGLDHLSPHDLRHAWATAATRAGTATRDLQEAGGWSSPAMPLRYAEAQEVANRGVKLKR